MPVEIKDIAVIVSGAITGIFTLSAVIITNFFNSRLARLNIDSQNRQKYIELKFSKMEEFYLLFEKWEANLSITYLYYFRCYCKKLSYKEVLELTVSSNKLEPGELHKLIMLLNIHFPELIHDYEIVQSARKKLVPFMGNPSETKLSIESFDKAQENFEKSCADFKEKTSKFAQKFNFK